MPPAAWKRIAIRTWNRSWIDNVGLVAAGVAFYAFISFIPLLAIMVLIYGMFADPGTVLQNMRALTAIIPGDVAALIGQQLLAAVEISGKVKGFAIFASLLVALYGGTNAASAIIMALNIAYQEKEKRGLLQFYLLAMAMTVAAVFLAFVAIAATAIVGSLDRLVPEASSAALLLGKAASYILLVLGASAVAASLYRYGPSREDARWKWISPGSIFTSLVWIALTIAFGFYIGEVANYEANYGAAGAVVALLTWMYFSAYVFIFGAELNSEIEHQTAKDSTTGPPEPIGRRGAWSADHVASDKASGATKEEIHDQPSMAEATPGSAKSG